MSVGGHRAYGFAYGLALRLLPWEAAARAIMRLDLWAWRRELEQHGGEMTPHGLAEARAWGEGARRARGIPIQWPSPPYPT